MAGIKRKKKIKIVLFVLFFVVVCGFFLYYLLFSQIRLNGDSVVVLNYKEEYIEKGFKATKRGKDVSKSVSVSGNVNVEKLGVYKLIYEIDGFFGGKKVRTVKVVDKEKPVLLIENDKKISLCPGSKYEKEQVQAQDNYDGDLSKKVLVNVTDNSVVYSVEDSSGNISKIEKNIVYEDYESPSLQLNGDKYIYVFLNEPVA